jgi:hypothetical protein
MAMNRTVELHARVKVLLVVAAADEDDKIVRLNRG